MTHPFDNSEFIKEWNKFIQNLNIVCEKKISERDDSKFKELESIVTDVINEISSERAQTTIQQATEDRALSHDDKVAIGFLVCEMKFFNGFFQEGQQGYGKSSIVLSLKTDEALGAGKTIKDSVEKVIKLPQWLKKLLSVLNELLSLIRGG